MKWEESGSNLARDQIVRLKGQGAIGVLNLLHLKKMKATGKSFKGIKELSCMNLATSSRLCKSPCVRKGLSGVVHSYLQTSTALF